MVSLDINFEKAQVMTSESQQNKPLDPAAQYAQSITGIWTPAQQEHHAKLLAQQEGTAGGAGALSDAIRDAINRRAPKGP